MTAAGSQGLEPAIAAIISAMILRAPDFGAEAVDRYREGIPDYANLPLPTINNDVLQTSTSLIEQLLDSMNSGNGISAEFEAELRDSAVRRFHQGVSIEALLQSYRLWSRIVWKEFRISLDNTNIAQLRAALEIADRIMAYVDQASVAVAQAFFAEVSGANSDRSLIRGETLDALLGGAIDAPEVERRLAALQQSLAGPHIIIVIRGDRSLGAGTSELRELLGKIRAHLQPAHDRLALGVRSQEIIAIYPAHDQRDEQRCHVACERLARELPRGVVGIGRRKEAITGIASSYREASEAATISDALGNFGRATHFREVLLDHVGRASTIAASFVQDVLKPLQEYDDARHAMLIETLRTFYESRFSLTRSAKVLHVHPNTVTYRLHRIQELTGLDATTPDDLLLLSLALKLNILG